MTDLPRGVEAEKRPKARPSLSKPLRAQYPEGKAGWGLYSRDLRSWLANNGNTPSPGFEGGPPKPRKSAVLRMLKNQGFQNFEGEDK